MIFKKNLLLIEKLNKIIINKIAENIFINLIISALTTLLIINRI